MAKKAAFWWVLPIAGVMLVTAVSCGGGDDEPDQPTPTLDVPISLVSSAFDEGQPIPERYTCDSVEDASPALSWSDAPTGTESFALTVYDPDARGGFVHWVLYNIAPDRGETPEGLPEGDTVLGDAQQGTNDFGALGYGGPCPPAGTPHRYVFMLYALDKTLGLDPGATKEELHEAMMGHVLANGTLTGTYQR